MRASTLLVALLLLMPVSAAAQATTPPPSRQTTQTTPAPPTRRGSENLERTRNVRLDLTITDTFGETPARKTISLLILDGQSGMIRTENRLPGAIQVQLNVDAMASIIANGPSVRVQVTFEYLPAQAVTDDVAKGVAAPRAGPGRLHESITVRLTNGKPLMVSQSADPASDRKVTVELTATILDAAPDTVGR